MTLKLKIDRFQFGKSWQLAEKVVNPKSPLEPLKGVYCDARGDVVRLVASDLKTGISLIAEGVTVIEPGEAILPCTTFGELLKKAAEQIVELTIDECKGTLKSGRNRYKISTYPVDGYPELPTAENAKPLITCKRAEFLDAITSGSSSCENGKDLFPKYLGCTYFKQHPDKLDVTSTDGKSLSLYRLPYESVGKVQKDFLVPVYSIKELQRSLASYRGDEDVTVSVDGTTMFATMGSLSMNVRLAESTFPNYERIMDINEQLTIEVDKNHLVSALERLNIIVRGDVHQVFWIMNKDSSSIRLVGRSPDSGEGTEEVSVESKTGDSLTISFNSELMLRTLKAFKGDFVTMKFTHPDGPLHVVDGSPLLYMLMPMKMKPGDLDDVI